MKQLHYPLLALFTFFTVCLQAQNWWDWKLPVQTNYGSSVKLDKQNNFITANGGLKKYDRNGALLWQQVNGSNVPGIISVDDSGNIYTTGFLPNPAGNIQKFDANGNVLWALTFPGGIVGLSASGDGDLYVVSTYAINSWPNLNDSIRFQQYTYPIIYPGGAFMRNLLISKINSAGVAQWLRVFSYPNIGELSTYAPVFSSIVKDTTNNLLYLSGGYGRSYFILDRDTIGGDFMSCGFLMQLNDNNGYANWGKKIPTLLPSHLYNSGGIANSCYIALKNNNEILLGGDDGYSAHEYVPGSMYGYQRVWKPSYYLRSFDRAGNELSNRHYTEGIRSLIKKGDNYYTYGNDTISIMNPGGDFIQRSRAVGVRYIDVSQTDSTIGAIGYTLQGYFVCKYLENKNRVSGYIYKDSNANGIKDSTEQGIANILVGEAPNRFVAVTGRNGFYSCYIDSGTHAITPLSQIKYNTFSPLAGHSITFTGFGDTAGDKNFGYTPIPGIRDLQINLSPYSATRPGFTAMYNAGIKNNGTDKASGTAGIKLPAGVTFIADTNFATPVFSSADSVAFAFSNLQPQADVSFNFKCQLSPSLVLNSMLAFYSNVLPVANDSFPSDNYDTLSRRVGGSFDPNDKTVFPDSDLNITQKNKPLSYLIRFQNTGNDTAFNVHIIDTLSSKLDIASLQIISSSHPVNIKVENNRVLHFYFDRINLVDSVHNEPMSHGFIRFKIKPAASVTIGDTVLNNAHIYFDFNAPVETNTTRTKYFSFVLPVTIRSFTALKNNAAVLLNLQTGTDIPMANFEVEKSNDGLQFTSIGNVKASILQQSYNFIDRQPLNGLNYYRLKLVAKDGSFAYSGIQIVQFSKNKSFSVYPNPATEILYILSAEKGSCTIYNAAGQIVAERKLQGTAAIDISKLAGGIYYIELNNNGFKTSQQFIVKR